MSLMHQTGSGAQSGELAFKLGVPAKASRAGALMIVVPGQYGCCVFDKELNDFEVTRCGLEFAIQLGRLFKIHRLEATLRAGAKLSSLEYSFSSDQVLGCKLLDCASIGDLEGIRDIHQQGLDLSFGDYDLRTAAHVAATSGHKHVLDYLYREGCSFDVPDGWGQTAVDEALRNGFPECERFMRNPEAHTSIYDGVRRLNNSRCGNQVRRVSSSGRPSGSRPGSACSQGGRTPLGVPMSRGGLLMPAMTQP